MLDFRTDRKNEKEEEKEKHRQEQQQRRREAKEGKVAGTAAMRLCPALNSKVQCLFLRYTEGNTGAGMGHLQLKGKKTNAPKYPILNFL